MTCLFIGFFENDTLIGTAIAQHINLSNLNTYGERDNFIRKSIRNLIFKIFAGNALFIGNNMITGQNCYTFIGNPDTKETNHFIRESRKRLLDYLKTKFQKTNIIVVKDFYEKNASKLKNHGFAKWYEFKHQPNMIFEIPNIWISFQDYTSVLSKKYRDQFKRAKKKYIPIECRELTLQEIVSNEERLYELYLHVARHAPFNTFFLHKNHLSKFKQFCEDKFKLFGHFLDGQLVGFHSILLNHSTLETYFLGYDEKIQKEKMLYLNMLYHMTEYAINHKFERIIFGRTAMEIKSSLGAVPVPMSAFIQHQNKWVNTFLNFIVLKVEPKTSWQQRHPFK